ncbi:MAG: ABC transporter permease [Paracoccus sp. (in: a-proteobacteria)]
MFQQRRTENMFQAGLTTLSLIFNMTVYKIRKSDRNAIIGLFMACLRGIIMVAAFYLMFYVLRVRASPIQGGNFIVYIMTGIFMYMTHTMAVQAVLSAENAVSPLMKHLPMNTAVSMSAAALASLYQQVLACTVLLLCTNTFIEPLNIYRIYPCIGMFIMAWFSGCCIGLVFRAAQPWWPKGVTVISQLYIRANMIASGKMFLANAMPAAMVAMFDWNPLFHIIDQARGFAFINYTPHNSSLMYPIYVTITLFMIGMIGEYVTRNNMSLSWGAGR